MLKARKFSWIGWLAVGLFCLVATAQPQQSQKQDIPDAPSTAQPPMPFPADTAPATKGEVPPPDSKPDATAPPPSEPEYAPGVNPAVASDATGQDPANSRDDLYKIVRPVNFVLVPVLVKDENDRLVNGLLPKDFAVYENGAKQKMTFFTSDPFPLSAAVVIDLGMPDISVQKVNLTFPALQGAFSQFDEVALYTYSNTVAQVSDFSAVGKKLENTMSDLQTKRGRNSGPPVLGGPLGPQGPMINGKSVDPNAPVVVTPQQESHTLNDAILAAALDLSKRERGRRKIIFVISDGREYRSRASYSDVLKVLLTNGIVVYGIGVEGAPIPGLGTIQKLHLPRFGTTNILPKYASATGGEVFARFSRQDIEETYARSIGDARNQYTIGYVAQANPAGGSYREIEIKVARPDCSAYAPPCVRTSAKAGYYPRPPERLQPAPPPSEPPAQP